MPFAHEAAAIEGYCDDHGIPRDSLVFDIRPSEVALPTLAGTEPLDLVFIDGGHGFPIPVIDWFYGAGLLKRGGVVVFDDVQLPQVSSFIELMLEPDPRWQALAGTAKWVAFRRDSEGSLTEGEWTQEFFPRPTAPPSPEPSGAPPDLIRRIKDLVPVEVKRRLRGL